MQQDTRLTQKHQQPLYTDDKWAEKEIRETVPFTIATNNIKYLGGTLTKQVEDLYDKNFKSLMKEIEEDTRKWKDFPCSWAGRINIVKMAILPKAIQFNTRQNSSQTSKEQCSTSYGKTKNPGQPKQSCTIKELKKSSLSLTSNSTLQVQ